MAALHLYYLSGLSTDTKPILEDALTGSTFEELDTQNIYVYSQNSKSWILSKNHKPKPEEEKPLVGPQTCIGIKKIEKTSTEGLVDTYTIEYTNGTNQQFNVVNSPKILSVNQELAADPLQSNKLYNIEISTSTDNPDETTIYNIYQPLIINANEIDEIITSEYLGSNSYWPRVDEGKFILHLENSNTDILFIYLGTNSKSTDYWQGYKFREDSVLVPYIGSFFNTNSDSYCFVATAQQVIDVKDLERQIREEAATRADEDTRIKVSLTNEIARAEQTEELLQANIEAEETRATDAETALQENLDSETERAIVAEQVLDGRIDDEIARATNEENALNTRIDNLDLAEVGQNGKYIKLVSQSNGRVSAAAADFDTTIPNSNASNITAPTTAAVKTYTESNFVSYIKSQQLTPEQLITAKTNIRLENVVNTGDSNNYKTAADTSNRKFTSGGAHQMYVELTGNDTDIQDEIDQIGSVIGYQRQIQPVVNESGDEHFEYVGDIFNYTYELDPNGFIQQTKNLADQNKSRLDNLENNQTGISVTGNGVGIAEDLTVNGDLIVKGTTTTSDQQTVQSESTIIVTNSTNAPLVKYSGTVALKGHFEEHAVNAENYHAGYFYYINDNIDDPTARVIVVDNHKYVLDESPTYTEGRQYYSECAEAIGLYDKDEDAVLIGEGNYYGGNFEFDYKYSIVTLTEYSYKPNTYYIKNQNNEYVLATGDFDPNETYYLKINQGQHLATRADSNNLTNGNLIEWDGTSYILKDAGKSIATLENEHNQENAARQSADTAIWTEIGDRSDKPNDPEDPNPLPETIYRYINEETRSRKIAVGDLEHRTTLRFLDNEDALANETSRAIVAETVLQDQIDELNAEVGTRLDEEIERAEAAERQLQENIELEQERAEAAEETLSANISAEENRASTAEEELRNTLQNNIDQVQENLDNETERAIIAEQVLDDRIDTNIATLNDVKADKSITVTNIRYTSQANVKTLQFSRVNDTTYTDIFNINTLKSDMELNNVTNDKQVVGLAPTEESGEPVSYQDHIVIFDYDGYHIKDSGKTLADTGKIDSISINGAPQPADAKKNVDLPAYPTQFYIDALHTDGLFDISSAGGYNQVSYSFAPYNTKQLSSSFYIEAVNPTLTDRLNYDGYFYATKLYSNGSETITENNISTITTSQIDNLFTEPYIADGDNEQF